MKRLIALVLAMVMAVMLWGCGATNALGIPAVVKFSEMAYVRPDMAELESVLQAACDIAREGKDLDAVEEGIWDFYDAYDAFYTNYNLAHIHYNANMEDYYWQKEQDYCSTNAAEVDAMLEELYYALAQSPLREELEGDDYFGAGFFDGYDGESIYDETLLAMLEQEASLINSYYALNADAAEGELYTTAWYDAWGESMAGILVELIALRQRMADYLGYDSYPEFAYDFYYYRDYTYEQADALFASIRQELVPLYRQMADTDVWDSVGYSSQRQTAAYVESCADAMGGMVKEAYRLMAEGELYDISTDSRKSGTSFEVFLTTYYEPYIFVSGTETDWDKLTFVHEFGHFVNDYAACGSYAGIDVEEFFSQGMEYLSLCYADGGADLTRLKLADCLATYVEQAAYAEFEHRMYDLKGRKLTVENLMALYEEIALEYAFDSVEWDNREFVTVPHFYEQPLYVISYVVSNDAALQLYQLEQAQPGAGVEHYCANLGTEEQYFLAFLEQADLESPFAPGRIAKVRETMENWIFD